MQIYRYNEGADSPGGSLTLSFEGSTTRPIPWNATVGFLEAALESLPQVGDVTVAVDPSTGLTVGNVSTKMTWLVEFTTLGTPPNLGNLPLLEADGSYLTGMAISVTVEEVSAGCCTVDVSANGGADYTSVPVGNQRDTVAFRYQDRPAVWAISPASGPSGGGTRILVYGTGFDLPSPVLSKAGAVLVSAVDHGPTCVFGGQVESPAVRLNSTAMACTSPSTPHLRAAVMSVTVRWPGSVVPSLTSATFSYYEDVTLQSLEPRRGSNAGGYWTVASVGRGSFAAVGINVTCVVEVRFPSNRTGTYTLREFISPAQVVQLATASESVALKGAVKDSWSPSPESYGCRIPGIGEFFAGVDSEDWLDGDWGANALVSLSGNGGLDRSAPKTFTYAPRPRVLAAVPAAGGDAGGTLVTVYGLRFTQPLGGFDDNELLCKFGHAPIIPAMYISDDAVQCVTPQHANKAAITSVVVASAAVFHSTQKVLLRAPWPIGSQGYATSSSIFGTWTLILEGFETPAMSANATAIEVSGALSALPNIRNATVSAKSSAFVDAYSGLVWNETAYTVYFAARGGEIPMLSADETNLRVSSFEESAGVTEVSHAEELGFVLSSPVPQVEVSVVEAGHDGDGIVREIQVLRTNRPELSAEQQKITVATILTPTAEVRKPASWCDWRLLQAANQQWMRIIPSN